ncbi:aspartyl/asparaginyl beta-hydroxylase-like isoform X3 [Culex pipiens pallens]|uniref:aspartyl/asparaginyl beta-hydroxylase-like isoform X3 n=1 Tax=Culex pipiens pallens TaxID=42434 RepID=UPI0022AA7595|nr:aspartyl/asparaginyl beta-hydroxylase-like isoform X3 [Culex pipiens pallens]
MSGDVQPRKRKDKKRKKDDEDTVKETPVQKTPSAGAAQAATQVGDIQMHLHSDHGTGGHWCAKIVFFILLAGLGALIGLILIENRGLSNDDTPLSESRYAEYFSGWVDENREDDHHHEEILNALNQLEEHEDEDEGHDDAELPDDGEPFAEEDDHDDDDNAADDEDEEDEEPKLDDDEIEEIVATEKKVAEQEAAVAEDDDEVVQTEDQDNDDDEEVNDDDGDDDNDDGVNDEKVVEEDDDDDDDAGNDGNDDDGDDDQPDSKNENDDNDEINDDDDDDDEEEEEIVKEIDDLADADDDDDNTPFEEEEIKTNALNDSANNVSISSIPADSLELARDVSKQPHTNDLKIDETPKAKISAELLESQMDDLIDNYNKLAEMLNIPKEEQVPESGLKIPQGKDDDGIDQIDAEEEDDQDDEIDDDDDFENFVDNDGGEEEYLTRVKQEQQQQSQQKQQDKQESREESSLAVQVLVGAALIGAARLVLKPPSGPRPSAPSKSADSELTKDMPVPHDQQKNQDKTESVNTHKPFAEQLIASEECNAQAESILKDFINASNETIEGNVILIEDDQAELYSGDEAFEYEQDLYDSELEEIEEEAEEEVDDLAEKQLEQEEREIGSFVPTTFEEFSAMYRGPDLPTSKDFSSVDTNDKEKHTTPSETFHKESPLMKKKPPKGAVSKLIYGLHKDPIITGEDTLPRAEKEDPSESDISEMDHSPDIPDELELPVDNGSKENLFIPSEELQQEEEWDDDLIYEGEEDIDSMLLRQYPSDESDGSFSDDIVDIDEISDVDDSELMRRLDEKYGKLEVSKDPNTQTEDNEQSWTSISSEIPARPSEAKPYQEELDRANRQLDEWKNPKKALDSFQQLLEKDPNLVSAMIGKARALDLMAEQQQSNPILEEAIAAFQEVLSLGSAVDNGVFLMAAERYIDRVRFRGQYMRAVPVQQELVRRFDAEPKFRNQLAVTYLMANRMAEAKVVLHETLMRWIDDGFALVHYGFVLKNHDKDMEQAAQFLQEGIDTGHPGTQDGRFYFHLGDALQRLGRQQEALKVYENGSKKKLFLSKYQRSLYNIDSLKSRPFWTVEQTTYSSSLQLIASQWNAIRDEGMRLLNAEGNFKDEAENLRDTGDWKQFELFARGNRIANNCAKAPITCKLVEQFTAARTCKRGQVKFSVMHPGTHVWPHCGPTNCRIRAHLGLKVPSGTYLRVAEQTRSWESGQWLIFDDSFEHEVWHNGTGTRLVLIVDFWHPELTETQRKSLSPI